MKNILSCINCWLFIVFYILIGTIESNAQGVQSYRFNTFSSYGYHQGISSIAKDSQGLIWFCAEDALVCFDGYTFTDKSNMIRSSKSDTFRWYFAKIYIDKQDNIYLGSNQGLYVLDRNSFKFKQLCDGYVESIQKDEEGKLWIVRQNAVGIYNNTTQQFEPLSSKTDKLHTVFLKEHEHEIWFGNDEGKVFKYNKKNKNLSLVFQLPVTTKIQRIGFAQDNIFVLTSNKGLYKYNKQNKTFTHYPLSIDPHTSARTKDMYVDALNNLWIATQTGLYILNIKDDKISLLQNDPHQEYGIPHNSIWTIYPDPDGGIWLGTYGGNIAYTNALENPFHFKNQNIGNSLSNNVVSCFEEDADNTIWIGTEGGGLNSFNMQTQQFKHLTHQSGKNSIGYNNIKCLWYEAKTNKLWLGMYKGGLNSIDLKTGRIHDYHIAQNIYCMTFVDESNVYLSDPEVGVSKLNFKTGESRKLDFSANHTDYGANKAITSMLLDEQNRLWLIGRAGLILLNNKDKSLIKSYAAGKEPTGLSGNWLFCISRISTGDTWIGTNGQGITVIDKEGNTKHIGEQENLTASVIYGIVEDRNNKLLWLSTNAGIMKYDMLTKQFSTFNSNPEFGTGAFYPNASFISKSNIVFFGRTNGFVYFDPAEIQTNKIQATASIIELRINNQVSNLEMKGKPFAEYLRTNTPLQLTYKQNNVGFSFSSNNYLHPTHNQFAYYLEGLDNDWHYLAKGEHKADYTQLPSGKFTLKVKTANNDGVWGEEITSFSFKVPPPPWLSLWAYLVYFILLSITIYLIGKYFLHKKKLEYKLQIERVEKENLKELAQLKMDFFTQISHELRTPLSLIIDPAKRLLGKTAIGSPEFSLVSNINKNAQKLYLLINQLLEIRTIESKKVRIREKQGDIILFLKELFNLFIPIAHEKSVEMYFQSSFRSYTMPYDEVVLEKIISNLLSNAVKYTQALEKIEMRAEVDNKNEWIIIEVKNTGVVLTKDEENSLFTSFYRTESTSKSAEVGTGLGLSIAKELSEALQGSIHHQYIEQKLSFIVRIPIRRSIDADKTEINKANYNYAQNILLTSDSELEVTNPIRKHEKSILIVEDNTSLRNYLHDLLIENYQVLVAENGEKGLQLAQKENPTLILSDVMMPKMSGVEMCQKLKTNLETSHIPIILLTALNSLDRKIEGLKYGADAYIEKPFDTTYLLYQIKNLIQTRENMRKLFSGNVLPQLSEMTATEADEEFLRKTYAIIIKNLDNPEFDVDQFVSEMGIGRTVLYKKLNTLTNMSIKEFIIDFRVKRACELLVNSPLSISEVAYKVGFKDTRYFSTLFKKHLGKTPSEFIQQGNKN